MSFLIHGLGFDDVDPSRHPYDSAAARVAVNAVVLAAVGGDEQRRTPVSPWSRESLERAITRALVRDVGPWAAGFSWCASEPGGGGPVTKYCCDAHSLLRPDDAGIAPTVDRVVDALSDFRAFLEELAARFEAIHARTAALRVARSVEHAASELLGVVLERTGAEDAWYTTFAVVMGWYLQSVGHEPARARALVTKVLSGRFESWVTPAPQTSESACADLGLEVAIATEDSAQLSASEVDASAEWRRIRANAFRNFRGFGFQNPVSVDGHARFIETVDRTRDHGEERAIGMRRALAFTRTLARKREPLTLARLSEIQALVLGAEHAGQAELRASDAYAKGGRERYPVIPALRAQVERDLADAHDDAVHVAVRAARVYLDLAFVHPFPDGNARASRLALDYVLTREGRALHAAEPIFLLSRSSADAEGAYGLAWMIEFLSGPGSF